jgi:hypothetical protein
LTDTGGREGVRSLCPAPETKAHLKSGPPSQVQICAKRTWDMIKRKCIIEKARVRLFIVGLLWLVEW